MLPESKTGNVKMFPRSTIQEANRHLQALYKRVDELEAIISKQHQQQLATESAYKEEISDLNLKHEEDVSLLEQRIQDLENQVKICFYHSLSPLRNWPMCFKNI